MFITFEKLSNFVSVITLSKLSKHPLNMYICLLLYCLHVHNIQGCDDTLKDLGDTLNISFFVYSSFGFFNCSADVCHDDGGKSL